jgi:transcriptional regulator with XRE-family HTH domain
MICTVLGFCQQKRALKGFVLNSAIAERLRAWRKYLGLTQEEFSMRTGLHIGVLRKYENDVNVPGGEALIAIGKTGVNLNWLLLGEEAMCCTQPSEPDDVYLRRLDEVRRLLDGLEEGKRDSVLDEIFSRVQEAKRVTDLERLVREMARKLA